MDMVRFSVLDRCSHSFTGTKSNHCCLCGREMRKLRNKSEVLEFEPCGKHRDKIVFGLDETLNYHHNSDTNKTCALSIRVVFKIKIITTPLHKPCLKITAPRIIHFNLYASCYICKGGYHFEAAAKHLISYRSFLQSVW